jgi:hypothetical protein
MASRFILPYADVGSGITPEDGAKLFFFISGTSTPKDTYTDKALTTPNTNPVIANSQGVFPDIWISGPYKVQLFNKNDVPATPGEWDPVEDLADGSTITVTINSLARTSVESYLENKEVAGYAGLISLAGVMGTQIADGEVCAVTDSGIAGDGVFRNAAAHGLTSILTGIGRDRQRES